MVGFEIDLKTTVPGFFDGDDIERRPALQMILPDLDILGPGIADEFILSLRA